MRDDGHIDGEEASHAARGPATDFVSEERSAENDPRCPSGALVHFSAAIEMAFGWVTVSPSSGITEVSRAPESPRAWLSALSPEGPLLATYDGMRYDSFRSLEEAMAEAWNSSRPDEEGKRLAFPGSLYVRLKVAPGRYAMVTPERFVYHVKEVLGRSRCGWSHGCPQDYGTDGGGRQREAEKESGRDDPPTSGAAITPGEQPARDDAMAWGSPLKRISRVDAERVRHEPPAHMTRADARGHHDGGDRRILRRPVRTIDVTDAYSPLAPRDEGIADPDERWPWSAVSVDDGGETELERGDEESDVDGEMERSDYPDSPLPHALRASHARATTDEARSGRLRRHRGRNREHGGRDRTGQRSALQRYDQNEGAESASYASSTEPGLSRTARRVQPMSRGSPYDHRAEDGQDEEGGGIATGERGCNADSGPAGTRPEGPAGETPGRSLGAVAQRGGSDEEVDRTVTETQRHGGRKRRTGRRRMRNPVRRATKRRRTGAGWYGYPSGSDIEEKGGGDEQDLEEEGRAEEDTDSAWSGWDRPPPHPCGNRYGCDGYGDGDGDYDDYDDDDYEGISDGHEEDGEEQGDIRWPSPRAAMPVIRPEDWIGANGFCALLRTEDLIASGLAVGDPPEPTPKQPPQDQREQQQGKAGCRDCGASGVHAEARPDGVCEGTASSHVRPPLASRATARTAIADAGATVLQCSVCLSTPDRVLWSVITSMPSTLQDAMPASDALADGTLFANPCRDPDHLCCVRCLKAILLHPTNPPVNAQSATCPCVSTAGPSCVHGRYSQPEAFAPALSREDMARVSGLYRRHNRKGSMLVRCPWDASSGAMEAAAGPPMVTGTASVASDAAAAAVPTPPGTGGHGSGSGGSVDGTAPSRAGSSAGVTRVGPHGAHTLRCTRDSYVSVKDVLHGDDGWVVTSCGAHTLCYHCGRPAVVTDGRPRCPVCSTLSENDNPALPNRYIRNPDVSAGRNPVADLGDASHMAPNAVVTSELAAQRIREIVAGERDQPFNPPCFRCGHGVDKTVDCNAVTHCGVERCYVCGRNTRVGGCLDGNHWNPEGVGGCPRYDDHPYWRVHVPRFVCRQGVCHDELRDCCDPKHADGIADMHEERRVWHVWGVLSSLKAEIRSEAVRIVRESLSPSDARRRAILDRVCWAFRDSGGGDGDGDGDGDDNDNDNDNGEAV